MALIKSISGIRGTIGGYAGELLTTTRATTAAAVVNIANTTIIQAFRVKTISLRKCSGYRAVVVLCFVFHSIAIALAIVVDLEFLLVDSKNVLGVQANALCQGYPEEEHVDDLHAGVLQIVQLESASLAGLGAPVLPEGAIAEFLDFRTHGCQIVANPFARFLRVEIISPGLGLEPGASVQLDLPLE